MALVSMVVPKLNGTSRLGFRAFSRKLRAYLVLNLHIPSIADAYEQLVDGWGDEADRAEALEALLDLVEEQLIDPPSHQAGLDLALVLGGKGCSSAKAFATAVESAVSEAIRRGTLTHFTAINHLFSHCLQVLNMRQEQRCNVQPHKGDVGPCLGLTATAQTTLRDYAERALTFLPPKGMSVPPQVKPETRKT
ncbi:hypothetical protein QJQ45_001465 [Haematococcus lacustris]|nr:hypothetical protein QJQ45_001465 [Haematococcus lacustris]